MTPEDLHKKIISKKFHKFFALRTAIITQLILDEVDFRETRIKRCWTCHGIYLKELTKLNKKLGIDEIRTGDYMKERLQALCKKRGIK